METSISHIIARASPSFLRRSASTLIPRPLTPSHLSIGRRSIIRLRSHNYNLIKPQIRERRGKQRWRWQQQQELLQQEDDLEEDDDVPSDEELTAEEMEVLEKEAMEGPAHKGREPSDYDRRAHIFDRSSRVFKVLKEKNETATETAADK